MRYPLQKAGIAGTVTALAAIFATQFAAAQVDMTAMHLKSDAEAKLGECRQRVGESSGFIGCARDCYTAASMLSGGASNEARAAWKQCADAYAAAHGAAPTAAPAPGATTGQAGVSGRAAAIAELRRMRDECEQMPELLMRVERMTCVSRCTEHLQLLETYANTPQQTIDARLDRCRTEYDKAVAKRQATDAERNSIGQQKSAALAQAADSSTPAAVLELGRKRRAACESGNSTFSPLYDCACLEREYPAQWRAVRDERVAIFYQDQLPEYEKRIEWMRRNGQPADLIAQQEQQVEQMKQALMTSTDYPVSLPRACLSRDKAAAAGFERCNAYPDSRFRIRPKSEVCGCYGERFADELMRTDPSVSRREMRAAQAAMSACNKLF